MTYHNNTQFGRYRLISLLGEGSFGEVYLAETSTKEFVAIKIIKAKATHKLLIRFIDEVGISLSLKHPHIVSIKDARVESETQKPYFVMAYAPYGTLRQRYPKGTQVPVDKVILYIKHVAEALQYAHNKELIHCDVKPENILLGKDQQALLSDFGISQVIQGNTSSPTNAGTPLYMAPEQYRRKPVYASDQYALAIVAYEWLAGNPPFNGNEALLYYQHTYENPLSLCQQVPSIASEIENVLFKALSKNATHRYATVKQFATELEKAYKIQLERTKSKENSSFKKNRQEPNNKVAEGDKYRKEGLYKEAITVYNEIIRSNNKHAVAYNNRGLAYNGLKDYEEAINNFNLAVIYNPDLAHAFYNRGCGYNASKQYVNAIADFSSVINLVSVNNPLLAKAYHGRGVAYFHIGYQPGALADFNSAISLNRSDATIYFHLGYAYVAEGNLQNYEKAIENFTMAIELDPRNAKAYKYRAVAREKSGDKQGALEDYNLADAFKN